MNAAFRNTIPADQETNTSNVHNTQLASTSEENSVETEQITTFHDVETPNRIDTPMAQDTSSARSMDDTHSIIQFLQRPVLIDHIEVIAGSTADDNKPLNRYVLNRQNPQPFVRSWTLPSVVLSAGGKGQKLANFKYLRCDVKVKIVLNANPFIAGRLYLAYSPYDDRVDPARSILNTSRAGVTGYPGIEIDFQLDNSVEMTIPYASFQEAYDLVTGTEDFVKLYLFTITPILSPTSTSASSKVDLSVYMWLDNISLVIPTYRVNTSIVPNVKTVVQTVQNMTTRDSETIRKAMIALRKNNKSTYDYIVQALSSAVPEVKNVTMQINSKKNNPNKMTTPVKEKTKSIPKPKTENPKIGPISELATGVNKVANGIERIPVIGEMAKPVTSTIKWVADKIGSVAAIFGWSKPRNLEQVNLYQNVPGWGYSLYKGIDNSVPLAFDPNNELGDLRDVFPSGVDEMAIGYVCGNPAVKHVLSWNTTDKVQVPISNGDDWGGVIPVGMPCYSKIIRKTENDTTQTKTEVLDPAPCEYVCNMFSYWRATMCYRIAIVKTAFHTGRLEIFFEPGRIPIMTTKDNISPDLTQLDGTKAPSDNNYKYILDLTNDTEITIRVPFVSNKMFMKSTGIYGGNSENNWDFSESFTGFLCIRPITKLMCPETVSNNVSIVVWKWAEDVVVVEPKPLLSGPTQVFQPPVTSADSINIIDASMQINLANKADENVITFFDSDDAEERNMEALLKGSGEQIMNLRSLLRTFRTISENWNLPPNTKTAITDLTDVADKEGRDYMSYLSYIYRFYRGGRRYKFFNTTALKQSQTCYIRSFLVPRYYTTDNTNNDGPSHITYPVLNPVHEVEVPYYCQYRKLPVASTTDKGYDASLMYYSNVGTNQIVARAGNDDFTFGWLIGTPQTQGITRTEAK
uniref:Capsid protein n=17 Tax=Acute bee paralysis virus TaxID=92444 RepID=Q8QHR2_9VIRU|nr:capsid protein [Acute bee paralysis virus]AAL05921.1 capsid protein [Acute bee paralysis virus]